MLKLGFQAFFPNVVATFYISIVLGSIISSYYLTFQYVYELSFGAFAENMMTRKML